MVNGQARQAALEIPVEELTVRTGANKLLEILDEVSLAYEAYETFEKDQLI